MKKRIARKKAVDASASSPPEVFGDMITADHVVFLQRDQRHDNKRTLLTMYDIATSWLEATPCSSKEASVATMALRDFAGRSKVKLLYSDNAPELIEAWPRTR